MNEKRRKKENNPSPPAVQPAVLPVLNTLLQAKPVGINTITAMMDLLSWRTDTLVLYIALLGKITQAGGMLL